MAPTLVPNTSCCTLVAPLRSAAAISCSSWRCCRRCAQSTLGPRTLGPHAPGGGSQGAAEGKPTLHNKAWIEKGRSNSRCSTSMMQGHAAPVCHAPAAGVRMMPPPLLQRSRAAFANAAPPLQAPDRAPLRLLVFIALCCAGCPPCTVVPAANRRTPRGAPRRKKARQGPEGWCQPAERPAACPPSSLGLLSPLPPAFPGGPDDAHRMCSRISSPLKRGPTPCCRRRRCRRRCRPVHVHGLFTSGAALAALHMLPAATPTPTSPSASAGTQSLASQLASGLSQLAR